MYYTILSYNDLVSSRFLNKDERRKMEEKNKDERRKKTLWKREKSGIVINNPTNLTRYYLYSSSVI